jgi:transcriptional regulator with XRE-family HTH domain
VDKNMVVDLTKRKAFGRKLKVILTKHDIRQNDLAKKLNVGRSYINQVCSGKAVFDGKKNSIIYDFFKDIHVSEDDLQEYSRLYIEARGNFNLSTIGQIKIKNNPLKSMIIEDLELLTEENLKKFRRYQEQLMETQKNNLRHKENSPDGEF